MRETKILTNDGVSVSVSESEISKLESHLRGEIILPDDESYSEARKLWNGLIDKKPGLIIQTVGVSDIIDSVNFARTHDLQLAVRGGGHNVAGHAMSDGGMVIDLSRMKSVRVDPEKRIAYAEAGATLGDLDRETHVFGLGAPVGVVSATGIAGLTLHGGMGWQMRKHGLTTDNVLSFDVVTADGRFQKASAEYNSDLFWALKGGGGNFGVVTSFEYQLHPVGPDVWFALVMYPVERAEKALRFFREYMATAPEELSAIGILWSAPPLPQVPEKFHGKPAFIFAACYTGPLEKGDEVIRPLRELDTPIADLSSPMKFIDLQRFLDEDYPDGRLYYWKSMYIHDLSDELINSLQAYAKERPSSMTSIDLWALGGAFGSVGKEETPLFHRDAKFLLAIESNWDDPSETERNIQWTRKAFGDLDRFSAGGAYLNFPGFAEEGTELVKGAYGGNYKRIKEIKAKYDPDNLFRKNINIR